MKRLFAIMFLLLCIAIPVAQAATATQTLDKLKANVAKITDPAEKERWTTNVELWSMETAPKAMASTEKMQAPLDTLQANVTRITDSAEKERWQANIDLWNEWMAKKDAKSMNETLGKMKTNVAAIHDAAEKERWQLNYDLWEAALKK